MKVENLQKYEQVLLNLCAKVEQKEFAEFGCGFLDPGLPTDPSTPQEKLDLEAVRSKLKIVAKRLEDAQETLPEILWVSEVEEIRTAGSKESARSPIKSKDEKVSPQIASPDSSARRWCIPDSAEEKPLFSRRSPRRSPRRYSPSYHKRERKKSYKESARKSKKINITLNVPEDTLSTLNTKDILSRIINCNDGDVNIDTLRELRKQILSVLHSTVSEDDIYDLILKSFNKRKEKQRRKKQEVEEGELSDSESEVIQNVYGSLSGNLVVKDQIQTESSTDKDKARKIQICLVINRDTNPDLNTKVNADTSDFLELEMYDKEGKDVSKTDSIKEKNKSNVILSDDGSDSKTVASDMKNNIKEDTSKETSKSNTGDAKLQQTQEEETNDVAKEPVKNTANIYKPMTDTSEPVKANKIEDGKEAKHAQAETQKRADLNIETTVSETPKTSKGMCLIEAELEKMENPVEIPLLNEPITPKTPTDSKLSEIDILQALKNELLSAAITLPSTETGTPILHQPKINKVASAKEILPKKRISIESFKKKTDRDKTASDKIESSIKLCVGDYDYNIKKPSLKLTEKVCERFNIQKKMSFDDDSEAAPVNRNADVDMRTLPPILSPNEIKAPTLFNKVTGFSTIAKMSASMTETKSDLIKSQNRSVLFDPRVRRDVNSSQSPSPHTVNSDRTPRSPYSNINQSPASNAVLTPNARSYEMTPKYQKFDVDQAKKKHVYITSFTMSERDREHSLVHDPKAEPSRDRKSHFKDIGDTSWSSSNVSSNTRYTDSYTGEKYVKGQRSDRYSVDNRDSFSYKKSECPRTTLPSFGRSEVPVTSTQTFSRLEMPMTPLHSFGRAECPTTPIHHFVTSECPPTPSHSFGRSECPSTPSHSFGRSECPPIPSRSFARSECPPTPVHSFGRSDCPSTPNHPFGSHTFNINEHPLTPSHQFSATDCPPTPYYGRNECPPTPNRGFARSDCQSTTNQPFGRSDFSAQKYVKDPRLNKKPEYEPNSHLNVRDHGYYKDRGNYRGSSYKSQKPLSRLDSYTSQVREEGRNKYRYYASEQTGHQLSKDLSRRQHIVNSMPNDYESDRMFSRECGQYNSECDDIALRRGNQRERSIGRSVPTEDKRERSVGRNVRAEDIFPRSTSRGPSTRKKSSIEPENKLLSVKSYAGRSFKIDTSVNETFQKFLDSGKGIQLFENNVNERRQRATSAGRALVKESRFEQVSDGSKQNSEICNKSEGLCRAASVGRDLAKSLLDERSFQEIKADFNTYKNPAKESSKFDTGKIRIIDTKSKTNTEHIARNIREKEYYEKYKEEKPVQSSSKATYSTRKNYRDPRMRKENNFKNIYDDPRASKTGIVYSNDNIVKGAILSSGYGIKNYKIPKIKRVVEEKEVDIPKKEKPVNKKEEKNKDKRKNIERRKDEEGTIKEKTTIVEKANDKSKDNNKATSKQKNKDRPKENINEGPKHKIKETHKEKIKIIKESDTKSDSEAVEQLQIADMSESEERIGRRSTKLKNKDIVAKTKKSKKPVISDSDSETDDKVAEKLPKGGENDLTTTTPAPVPQLTNPIKVKIVPKQPNAVDIHTNFGLELEMFTDNVVSDPVLDNINALIADLDASKNESSNNFMNEITLENMMQNITAPQYNSSESRDEFAKVLKDVHESKTTENDTLENSLLGLDDLNEIDRNIPHCVVSQKRKNTEGSSSKTNNTTQSFDHLLASIKYSELSTQNEETEKNKDEDLGSNSLTINKPNEDIVSTTELEKVAMPVEDKLKIDEGSMDGCSTPDSNINNDVLDKNTSDECIADSTNEEVHSGTNVTSTGSVESKPVISCTETDSDLELGNLLKMLQDKSKIKKLLNMLGDQSGDNDKIKKNLEKLSEILFDDEAEQPENKTEDPVLTDDRKPSENQPIEEEASKQIQLHEDPTKESKVGKEGIKEMKVYKEARTETKIDEEAPKDTKVEKVTKETKVDEEQKGTESQSFEDDKTKLDKDNEENKLNNKEDTQLNKDEDPENDDDQDKDESFEDFTGKDAAETEETNPQVKKTKYKKKTAGKKSKISRKGKGRWAKDIQEMFIRDDNLSATGIRMCRLAKMVDEKKEKVKKVVLPESEPVVVLEKLKNSADKSRDTPIPENVRKMPGLKPKISTDSLPEIEETEIEKPKYKPGPKSKTKNKKELDPFTFETESVGDNTKEKASENRSLTSLKSFGSSEVLAEFKKKKRKRERGWKEGVIKPKNKKKNLEKLSEILFDDEAEQPENKTEDPVLTDDRKPSENQPIEEEASKQIQLHEDPTKESKVGKEGIKEMKVYKETRTETKIDEEAPKDTKVEKVTKDTKVDEEQKGTESQSFEDDKTKLDKDNEENKLNNKEDTQLNKDEDPENDDDQDKDESFEDFTGKDAAETEETNPQVKKTKYKKKTAGKKSKISRKGKGRWAKDIQEMFIRDDNLSATGIRMCRLAKMVDEKKEKVKKVVLPESEPVVVLEKLKNSADKSRDTPIPENVRKMPGPKPKISTDSLPEIEETEIEKPKYKPGPKSKTKNKKELDPFTFETESVGDNTKEKASENRSLTSLKSFGSSEVLAEIKKKKRKRERGWKEGVIKPKNKKKNLEKLSEILFDDEAEQPENKTEDPVLTDDRKPSENQPIEEEASKQIQLHEDPTKESKVGKEGIKEMKVYKEARTETKIDEEAPKDTKVEKVTKETKVDEEQKRTESQSFEDDKTKLDKDNEENKLNNKEDTQLNKDEDPENDDDQDKDESFEDFTGKDAAETEETNPQVKKTKYKKKTAGKKSKISRKGKGRWAKDIQEMFIRDDNLSATGIRMCRLAKMVDEKKEKVKKVVLPESVPVVVLEKLKNSADKSRDTPISENVRKKPGPKPKISTDSLPEIEETEIEKPKYKPGPKSKTKNKKELDPFTFETESVGDNTKEKASEDDSDNSSDSENCSLTSSKSFGSSEVLAEMQKKKRKRGRGWQEGVIKPKNKKKKLETKLESALELSDGNLPTEKQVAVTDTDCYIDKDYCFHKNESHYTCRLCGFAGTNIVHHFVNEHPHDEVPMSRMAPALALEAIEHCNYVNYKSASKISTEKYVCIFCFQKFPYNSSVLETFFWHMVSMHTGEYKRTCGQCSNTNRCQSIFDIPLSPNENGQLIGYICVECHFTQLSLENLKKHVSNRHNDQKTVVYTINLSVMSRKAFKEFIRKLPKPTPNTSSPREMSMTDDVAECTESEAQLRKLATKSQLASIKSKITFEADDSVNELSELKTEEPIEPTIKIECVESVTTDEVLQDEPCPDDTSEITQSAEVNNKPIHPIPQEDEQSSLDPGLADMASQPSNDIVDYPHFKINITGSGAKEYICCINEKDIHFKTKLLISMKKHVQLKHSENWDGYCFICKVIVTPQGAQIFKDCFQHYLDKHMDNFPIYQNEVLPESAPEEVPDKLIRKTESPALSKPFINVRAIKDLISTPPDDTSKETSSFPIIQSVVSLAAESPRYPTVRQERKLTEVSFKYEEVQAKVMLNKHRVVLETMMTRDKLVKVFKCAGRFCSFTSDSAEDALLHASTHQRIGGVDALTCSYCDFDAMGNAIDLVIHVFKEHGHCQYSCGQCFYRAAASQAVGAHATRVHGVAQSGAIVLRTTGATTAGDGGRILTREQAVPYYVCHHVESGSRCKFRTYTPDKFCEHLQQKHAGTTSHPCCEGTNELRVLPLAFLNKSKVPTEDVTPSANKENPVREAEHSIDLEKLIGLTIMMEPQLELNELTPAEHPQAIPEAVQQTASPIAPTVAVADVQAGLAQVSESTLASISYPVLAGSKTQPPALSRDSDDEDIPDTTDTMQSVIDLSDEDTALKRKKIPMQVHNQRVPIELLSTCPKCKQICKSINGLKKHFFYCYPDKNEGCKCPHCPYVASSCDNIMHHYVQDHCDRNIYQCGVCRTNLVNLTMVKRHLRFVHNEKDFLVTSIVENGISCYIVNVAKREKDKKELPKEKKELPKRNLSTGPTDKLKRRFRPQEINLLPINPVFDQLVYCELCEFGTKLRLKMVRHLQLHAKQQPVTHTTPVNPVPHLETNEKHFDKMVNLASSSLVPRADRSAAPERPALQCVAATRYPREISARARNTCGALGCSYTSVDKAMLKRHWEALHSGSASFNFRCVHCSANQTTDTSKPITAARVVQHLKMHDDTLYACSKCHIYHYKRDLEEKHMMDEHPGAPMYIVQESASAAAAAAAAAASTSAGTASPSAAPTMDLKLWQCGFCEFKSILRPEVVEHCFKLHQSKMQFRCGYCPYRASVLENVNNHLAHSHANEPEDVIYYYYKEGSLPDEADGTPRWMKQKQKMGATVPEVKTEVAAESHEQTPPVTLPPVKIDLKLAKKEVDDATAPESLESIDDLCKRFGNFCEPNGISFKCSLCKVVSEASREAMQSHLYEELQYRKWGCGLCNSKAFHKDGLTEHMNMEHFRQYDHIELPKDLSKERWVAAQLDYQAAIIDKQKANLAKQKSAVERVSKPVPVIAAASVDPVEKFSVAQLEAAFGEFGAPCHGLYCCPKCTTLLRDEAAMRDHLESELNKIRWGSTNCSEKYQTNHEAQFHCKGHDGPSRPKETVRDPSMRAAWVAGIIQAQKKILQSVSTPTGSEPPSPEESFTETDNNSLLVVRYEKRVPLPELAAPARKRAAPARKRAAPARKRAAPARKRAAPESDDVRLKAQFHCKGHDGPSRPKETVRDPSMYAAWVAGIIQAQKKILQSVSTPNGSEPPNPEESFTETDNNSLLVVRYEKRVPLPELAAPARKRAAPASYCRKMRPCPHCPYKTIYYNTWKKHVLKHHNLKPFSCCYCDYSCSYRPGVIGHTEKVHPNELLQMKMTAIPPGESYIISPKKRPPLEKEVVVSKVICLFCENSIPATDVEFHLHEKIRPDFARKGDVVVKCCICLVLRLDVKSLQEHHNLAHPHVPVNYALFKLHHDTRETHYCGHCDDIGFKFLRDLKTHHNAVHPTLLFRYTTVPYISSDSHKETRKREEPPQKSCARKSTTKLPGGKTVARKSTTKLPYGVPDASDDGYSYYKTKPFDL